MSKQAFRVTKHCVTHTVFSQDYALSVCLTHEVLLLLRGLDPVRPKGSFNKKTIETELWGEAV